jgi:hypothetical protein
MLFPKEGKSVFAFYWSKSITASVWKTMSFGREAVAVGLDFD